MKHALAASDKMSSFFPYDPEGKSGKNRLHIDLHSEPDGMDKLVTRLEDLGAARVREVNKGPAGHWWIMQDPEGNEFCVA
nr:VOC family protein [Micromonospora sp. KC207]